MTLILQRIRRRKLVQWAVAYCAAAWVGLQVLELLSESFVWATRILRPATILAGFGLLATLIVGWFHGERGRQRITAGESLAIALVVVLAGATLRWDPGVRREVTASGAIEHTRAIAVLPFENLSADSANQFFVAGFHDNLLAALSKVGSLRVISRGAVRHYAGTDKSMRTIAEELSVGSILDGSVQRDEDQIRIIVQLVEPVTGTQIWAETYDRRLDDLFSIQTDITQRVAWALEAALTPEEERRIEAPITHDLSALDFYLLGVEAYDRTSAEDNEEAVRLFREAIARDQDFAAAWARLGDAYLQRVQFFGYPATLADSARAFARRAVELDPDLALAHKTLGFVSWTEGRIGNALSRFIRAIELDPNFASAINNAGFSHYYLGDMAEALALVERAFPLEPNIVLMRSNVGALHLVLEDLNVARRWLDEALSLDPRLTAARNWRVILELYDGQSDDALALAERFASDRPAQPLSWTRAGLAAIYARRYEEALRHARRAREIAPGVEGFELRRASTTEGIALARLGRHGEARRVLEPVIEEELARVEGGADAWAPPWELASSYAVLGEGESGLQWLERAFEAGYLFPRLLDIDPAFDDVRNDERFGRVLESMRVELERQRGVAKLGDR